MPASPLAGKMKRGLEARAAIVGAPPGFEPAASALRGSFDWIQLFVRNQAELGQLAPKAAKVLKPGSLLWICFPKGSSNIQTDLTRDRGWDPVRKLDLKWITLISVDATWSACALRPYKPGEARQSFR